MYQSGVIYQYCPTHHTHNGDCFGQTVLPAVPHPVIPEPEVTAFAPTRRGISSFWYKAAGSFMIGISLVGVSIPLIPKVKLETAYVAKRASESVQTVVNPTVVLPPSAPVLFNPLVTPDGKTITPVNTEFSIVVPKVGINSAVIAGVNPLKPAEYTKALQQGVAHASTSYLPDQPGTTYLFSHSTNYEWFVKDLNAVFYHLKNLEEGDVIVLFYKGKRYTYKYRSQQVVSPKDISYLVPQTGNKQLILQTCWPPGSVAQRLLIFADLIDEQGEQT